MALKYGQCLNVIGLDLMLLWTYCTSCMTMGSLAVGGKLGILDLQDSTIKLIGYC